MRKICKGYYMPTHHPVPELSPKQVQKLRAQAEAEAAASLARRQGIVPDIGVSEHAIVTSPIKGIKKKFSEKNFKNKLPNGKPRAIKTPVIIWAMQHIQDHEEVSVAYCPRQFKRKTVSQALHRLCRSEYITRAGKVGACVYYKKGEFFGLLVSQ